MAWGWGWGWGWAFCLLLCVESIGASQFIVGDQKGWGVPSGSESYNQWAGQKRFHINDTLLFKYPGNVDSVLQVSAQNYKSCNTTSPKKTFKDGNTSFPFHRQGAFYFISGNGSNCKKGEKVTVVVLSPCHRNLGGNCTVSSSPTISPTPSPSPSSSHGLTPTPISPPSLSPSAESPEFITPSSSANFTTPAPTPIHSASSSSAILSLLNLVIPLLLIALLKPIL